MAQKPDISAALRWRLFIVQIDGQIFQNHSTITPQLKWVFYVTCLYVTAGTDRYRLINVAPSTHQLDFLKSLKMIFQQTEAPQDLRPWKRGLDEANPILPGLFLFWLYLESYFEKAIHGSHKNRPSRSGFSSLRAFCTWSQICCSPFGLLGS